MGHVAVVALLEDLAAGLQVKQCLLQYLQQCMALLATCRTYPLRENPEKLPTNHPSKERHKGFFNPFTPHLPF